MKTLGCTGLIILLSLGAAAIYLLYCFTQID